MAGSQRWPPAVSPQLPTTWIRAGLAAVIFDAVLIARDTLPTQCGFEDEPCRPLLGTLGAFATTVFWFWLIAPCVTIAHGFAHVARVMISWLRLDVLRPRRARLSRRTGSPQPLARARRADRR